MTETNNRIAFVVGSPISPAEAEFLSELFMPPEVRAKLRFAKKIIKYSKNEEEALRLAEMHNMAFRIGISAKDIVKAAEYTKSQDLSFHYETIDEISSKMGVYFLDKPNILIVNRSPVKVGGVIPSEINWDETPIQVNDAKVYFSKKIEKDKVAIKGFYAHEIAEICIQKEEGFEDYWKLSNEFYYHGPLIRGRKKIKSELNKMRFGLEKKVDEYASSHGYEKEIKALRGYVPIEKTCAFKKT